MLSNEAGSNLRLKRGRSRSRGRPTKQPTTAALVQKDYDFQRMTRSRSRSRGRIPETVQQGEKKEGTVIGSSARIEGSSPSSRFRGGSGLIYKTDRCSTISSKILPQSSQQETYFSNSGGVRDVASPPSPYNVYINAPRPLPVPAQKKPSSTVPCGLPMFSFLSTPNPANQASRKRPQESNVSINYGKRRNSNTDELPGCHFQTTHYQTYKDVPTNARSNQIIVSPLNRLFSKTSANQNQTPQHSSFSQAKIQQSLYPDYPDIEIIPVSANENSDFNEGSHSTAPENGGGAQINSNCGTYDEEPTVPLSSYVDARPANRIRFPIRKERPVSTNLKNSFGCLVQEQALTRSLTGEEADHKTETLYTGRGMRLDDVTITPVIQACRTPYKFSMSAVISITDDEDDDCVSHASVSGVDDEVTPDISDKAVVNHVSVSEPSSGCVPAAPMVEMPSHDKCTQEQISGGNHGTVIGSYDGDDDEEEEYHDAFEDLDEQHEPTKNLTDEETIKPKRRNWCIIA